ncbi:MAG: hypothetical protein Q7T74_06330 [Candidatus Saccharibacteria bacterium]|nr:hypothetical protein [Candidatus Saccharibacteria bacterium]
MISQKFDLEAMLDSLRLDTETPSKLQLLQLKHVIQRARPYSGSWEFPWLITPWNSTTWETTNGTKTRIDLNGNWIDTEKTNWDFLLPDGHRLTDPHYANLLETCRRLSALVRIGYADRHPPSIGTWQKFNVEILKIIHWLVLHKNRFRPDEEGFKLLDQAGLKQLLMAIAKGGWCEANSLVERCLSQLHLQVFHQPIPQSVLAKPAQLPAELCDSVIIWLKRNEGFYVNRGNDSGRVSRELLAKLISASKATLSSHVQLDAVLRQFEVAHQNGLTLVSGSQTTEYPRHSNHLISQAVDRPGAHGTVKILASHLRRLFCLYPHLPDRLPSPVGINLSEASAIAYSRSAGVNHTPFIPIDVGLKYLNLALKWVALYGDALIDYLLLIMEKFIFLKDKSKSPGRFNISANGVARKVFAETPLPAVLRDAGFSFSSYLNQVNTAKDFSRLREKPCLDEALRILIGAATITIGLLKPSRDLEIVNLPRNCLSRSPQGLYWLDSPLGKRTRVEWRARTGGKPIPFITAKAIRQFYKLNRGLTRIFKEKDSYKRGLLFYLPNPRKLGSSIKLCSGTLNRHLDLFCDYAGLPPDEYGRRWYIRIHEMRKWFLLLLFWSGRYDVLDAARWVAGHTDVKHLYDYIQREFPDVQLGKLEAECAIDKLAQYDQTQVTVDGESIGLVQLYERVLRHFRVGSLSLIKESDWHLLVEELFEDEYHLEPYMISVDGDSKCLCVAIRVGSRQEERK